MAPRISSLGTFGMTVVRGAFGLFGALGVFVAGCSDETSAGYSSYCDSTGCYSCDGYGCTQTSPPPSSGSSCTTDANCPTGNVCNAGVCAPASTPVADAGTSSPDADTKPTCGGDLGPCACKVSADCKDSGQVCVAGSCTNASNACRYSSECGTGKICADGQCLTSCTTTCTDGYTCTKGVCAPNAPTCDAGNCAPSCAKDTDCGAGNYCNQGACVVDTRPQPNCTTDAQCGGTSGTPKKCLGGFCKYTCDTDAYCRTIDSRIGYCAADKVCRSSEEANAQCKASSDCTNGKTCVDNTCK